MTVDTVIDFFPTTFVLFRVANTHNTITAAARIHLILVVAQIDEAQDTKEDRFIKTKIESCPCPVPTTDPSGRPTKRNVTETTVTRL